MIKRLSLLHGILLSTLRVNAELHPHDSQPQWLQSRNLVSNDTCTCSVVTSTDIEECSVDIGALQCDVTQGSVFTGTCGDFSRPDSSNWCYMWGEEVCCAPNKEDCCRVETGSILLGVFVAFLLLSTFAVSACLFMKGCPERCPKEDSTTLDVSVPDAAAIVETSEQSVRDAAVLESQPEVVDQDYSNEFSDK